MAGFPAGVARHAIDLFTEAAKAKRRGPSASLLADSEIVQAAVGHVDGSVRSSRAHFVDAIGAAWETVTSGDRCTLQQRALVISATQTLMHAASAAVDTLVPLAGTSALYEDNPLQRCVQDLHTARQHIFYSTDNLVRVGKALLGVDQPEHLL